MDKMFTSEIRGDAHHPLVETITSLGMNTQMQVIAEGVEHQQQVHLLSTLDCHLFQGYFFSKALPADAFSDWLAQQTAIATAQGGSMH